MAEKKPQTVCERAGHAFVVVEDSDTRVKADKDTVIHRAFVCTKCGEVITPRVATWHDFIPHRQAKA